MLTYNTATLQKLIVHFAGNPQQDEPLMLAEKDVDFNPDLQDFFLKYFLHAFKPEEFYQFNTGGNPVYEACKNIFSDGDFVASSADIARKIYEETTHPKILSGDLFVAKISKINLHNEFFDAIVILKAEKEDDFIQVEWKENQPEIQISGGYRNDRIDKACLVISSSSDDGYRVLVVDKTNGNAAEAQYWTDAFLQLEAVADSYHHTTQYMHIYKDFIKEKLPEDFEVNPAEQIALLNRSSKFFKEKEKFNFDDFANEVIQQPEVANAFQSFSRKQIQDGEHSITESFDINQNAVKKHSGMFKSVLKLDKNFHIYIHGNRNLIERGFDDDRNMNYYKVYFMNEITS